MFSPWHRVRPYTLSVCGLNGYRLMAVEKVTTMMTPLLMPRHQGATARDLPPPALCRDTPSCAGSVHLTLVPPHSSEGETDTQQSCTSCTNLPRRETRASPARLHRPLSHTNHGAEENTHVPSKYLLRAYCVSGPVPGSRTEDMGIQP